MLELVKLVVVRPSTLIELVLDKCRHFPLLGKDCERKVVQGGLAVRVQEIDQVAVAPEVPLDQGVFVLPSLVWVYLLWWCVTYVAGFFIIDVSTTVIEVQLFSIFVMNSLGQKVLY